MGREASEKGLAQDAPGSHESQPHGGFRQALQRGRRTDRTAGDHLRVDGREARGQALRGDGRLAPGGRGHDFRHAEEQFRPRCRIDLGRPEGRALRNRHLRHAQGPGRLLAGEEGKADARNDSRRREKDRRSTDAYGRRFRQRVCCRRVSPRRMSVSGRGTLCARVSLFFASYGRLVFPFPAGCVS